MPICILLYSFHMLQLRSVSCLNKDLSVYLILLTELLNGVKCRLSVSSVVPVT